MATSTIKTENRGSVSVTADGNRTWSELLNDLFNSLDITKLTIHTLLTFNGYLFTYSMRSGGELYFSSVIGGSGANISSCVTLKSNNSSYVIWRMTTTGNALEILQSQTPTAGTVLTLYY